MAKFSVIIGPFIQKDWTVVKIMGTAVVVGSVGIYPLVASGHANLHVKADRRRLAVRDDSTLVRDELTGRHAPDRAHRKGRQD